MDILSSPLPGLLQFCPKVVPTIGERILGPILNQVKYPTTCMSITTFAFKWPNRTSQLCKRESVDKMGGVVTTGMGGICLNWALCLRFVLAIAICRSIWKQHLNPQPDVVVGNMELHETQQEYQMDKNEKGKWFQGRVCCKTKQLNKQNWLKSNRFDFKPILCDINMKNCQEGKAT